MLEIFNRLEPFFIDNYRKVNVREYGRIMRVSPPSASKYLETFHKESLLNKEKDRNFIFYSANRDSRVFVELSKIYWHERFIQIGLIDYFEKELVSPLVVLFGSFSKAEINEKSDVDIAIFTISEKVLPLSDFEKKNEKNISGQGSQKRRLCEKQRAFE